MKILIISVFLSYPLMVFARDSQTINIEVSIQPIQKLTMLASKQFPNLVANNLDKGFSELENCIEIEVKSNVPWALVVYNDSFKEGEESRYELRRDQNPYLPITHSEILLFKSNSPTSGEIINIDCKRSVSWDTTKPGKWEFSPLFKLIPLIEN